MADIQQHLISKAAITAGVQGNRGVGEKVPRFVFPALLLLFWLFVAFSLLADQTISYEAYLVLIGQLRQQTQVAMTQEGATCRQTLAGVADVLAAVTAVQLPNGAVMAVDHSAITNAIRSQPCDGLRASELLAGICPNRVCPVTAVPPDPSSSSAPSGIPQLDPNVPIQPSQDVLDQVEQLLEEAQALATPEANAADPSVEESGQTGSDADAGDLSDAEASSEGASSDAAEDGAADEGGNEGDQPGETGDSGEGGSGEGESSGENGETAAAGDGASSDETGAEGETTESGEGEAGIENGGDSGEGETGESGVESSSETADASNSDSNMETAAGENGGTAVQPTGFPSNITPPEPNRTPAWVWGLIGMALLALAGGAVMLLLSQQPEKGNDLGQKEPATSAEAVDVGRELMLAGSYRAAVRHIFLAALLAMDERGVLYYDTTRTNYELLQELQFKPYAVQHLTPVVETFERVWYGFEVVDMAEYDALAGQIDLLKQV